MKKPTLWLLIGSADAPEISLAAATAAWVAQEKGVLYECYFEAQRDGTLFARSGSTVLGGHHHQQLNYLAARTELKVLLFGESHIFASTLDAFGCETVVEGDTLGAFYTSLFRFAGVSPESVLTVAPTLGEWEIAPYAYPEIIYTRAAAFFPSPEGTEPYPELPRRTLWLPEDGTAEAIDPLSPADTVGSVTLHLAHRWQHRAKGVAFGDPDAIRSMIPTLCRENRVPVYAPADWKKPAQVEFTSYTESHSAIAGETAELALAVGNPVLVGRQTCDGDLFLWGKKGVSMQIMDPNRPAFPVVAALPHVWRQESGSLWDREPDDGQLEKWASEGKVLTSLIFHSGEMAHNEAMLQLVDYCSFTGFKLGIGAHLKRYETCPQQWELIHLPRERGGARGLIEPLLHSGGLGIMAESGCPAEDFRAHCRKALEGIRAIAGAEDTPRGYYFFCDTDLPTLRTTTPELYAVLEELGMRYAVSSALPGRNCLLGGEMPVLNQTSRTVCGSSPFIRITSREDVLESGFQEAPGWFIGVLDAPVISFSPYIWKEGSRFCKITELLQSENRVNVLPDTVARYAKLLKRRGDIPS